MSEPKPVRFTGELPQEVTAFCKAFRAAVVDRIERRIAAKERKLAAARRR